MKINAILAKPPLNLLIDPTLAKRRSPWEINLTELLDMFLQAVRQADIIDLRAAGVAALSSATIYRLKVETLFLFEKLRARMKHVDTTEPPQIIVMPFRYEIYSTNIEELFEELARVLEGIVSEQSDESRKNPLPVEEIEAPQLEDYIHSLQSMFIEFRKILIERLKGTGRALLSELTYGLSPIDAARVFILLLFAAQNGEVVITQDEDDEDALIVSVGQLE